MKSETLQKIVEFLYRWDNKYTAGEAKQTYAEIVSWMTTYFRMFIGEEEFRGSKVAIFDDVKTYAAFKKWFCKHFTKKKCKTPKIPKGKDYVFFTVVEPAGVGECTHYTGARLFKDKLTFFDPAVGCDNATATWDGETVKHYVEKIAGELGLKFEKYRPQEKCQLDQSDIFCQTWSLMWEKKVSPKKTPEEATNILRGEKKKKGRRMKRDEDRLTAFAQSIIREKAKQFDKFVPEQIEAAEDKGNDFWIDGLFKAASPSEIILNMATFEFSKDRVSPEDKKQITKFLKAAKAAPKKPSPKKPSPKKSIKKRHCPACHHTLRKSQRINASLRAHLTKAKKKKAATKIQAMVRGKSGKKWMADLKAQLQKIREETRKEYERRKDEQRRKKEQLKEKLRKLEEEYKDQTGIPLPSSSPKTRQKRCPNGQRRNAKTKKCEPKAKPSPKPVLKSAQSLKLPAAGPGPTLLARAHSAPHLLTPPKKKATRRKRCPNGTRRNPKTKKCEPYTN